MCTHNMFLSNIKINRNLIHVLSWAMLTTSTDCLTFHFITNKVARLQFQYFQIPCGLKNIIKVCKLSN